MKRTLVFALLAAGTLAAPAGDFIRVKGRDLVDAGGGKFVIRGVNLGHWLNPEGYMFGFGSCSSPHFIDRAFRELVGDEATDEFWRRFKDNYVTEADIEWIAATGANTVRVPFHYKLFTDEDYLGLTKDQDGFRRLDDVVRWCAAHGLRAILDMHDCPGGQTGDNIDDSHGYPWLFESARCQKLYCDIWRKIAQRYANEPAVLGYDLMNEPVSSRLKDLAEINTHLKDVQVMAAKAIREADRNHVVIFGGAQWNTNFEPFGADFRFDDNSMFTCHHYDFGNPKLEDWKIKRYADIRDRAGMPMYMGETGHNDATWYRAMVETMAKYDIGWTFWPYKMPGGGWNNFKCPEGWDAVKAFAAADRQSYEKIQAARPDRKAAVKALMDYAENCRFANCAPDRAYLEALGLKVPAGAAPAK